MSIFVAICSGNFLPGIFVFYAKDVRIDVLRMMPDHINASVWLDQFAQLVFPSGINCTLEAIMTSQTSVRTYASFVLEVIAITFHVTCAILNRIFIKTCRSSNLKGLKDEIVLVSF